MVVDQLSIAAGGLTSNKPVRRAASPEMVRVPAPELRRLREEIIELRSQLAELLSSPDLTMHLSRRFRLTARAAALLALLCNREIVTRDAILARLFRGEDYLAADVGVRVLICRLRKELTPHGVSIDFVAAGGYAMPAADRARLKRLAGGSAP